MASARRRVSLLEMWGEVEEALRTEEEAIRHFGQPGRAQRRRQARCIGPIAVMVIIVAAAALRVEAAELGDPLEQCRLAGAIFADEKGDRAGEFEAKVAGLEEGQREREFPRGDFSGISAMLLRNGALSDDLAKGRLAR